MNFKWPWSRDKSEALPSVVLPQLVPQPASEIRRLDHVPEKVFIEREGDGYEYSEQEPPTLDRFYEALNGYYATQNYLTLFYELPEIFAPIHEIASRVADAMWQLRKEWNDEVDYKDEYFNKLFSQPNPLQPFKALIYQAVCYEILTGRQFFYLNKPSALPQDDYRSVVSWFNLPSPDVEVETIREADPYSATELKDFVRKYKISTREFPINNVLPVVNLSLRAGYDMNRPVPLIEGAKRAIRNLLPVYEARGIIYIKRGAMGFIVSAKEDSDGRTGLSVKEKQELERDYNRSYGLAGGKSTTGITRLPIDYIKTGMTIAEMLPFDETLADAVAIYKVLRVPRHFVPSKDNSTFANADSDEKAFYHSVIIPWATKYAEVFNNGFNFKINRRYVFPDYSHVPLLQENEKEKADVEKVKVDTVILKYEKGIIKKNERQAELGYSSLENGDVYSTDTENTEPLGIRLGVGGVQALQAVLASTTMSEDAKVHTLFVLFGISEEDATKMVKPNETTSENQGAQTQGFGN